MIEDWDRVRPAARCIIENGVPTTRGAFREAVARLCGLIEAAGLPERGTAGLLCGSIAENWAALWALRALGYSTVAAVDFKTLQELDIPDLVCIAASERRIARGDPLLEGAPASLLLPVPRLSAGAAEGARPQRRDLSPKAPHFLSSSGTLGRNKLIAMEPEHEVESSRKRARVHGNTEKTVMHNGTFGLWTAAGFRFPLNVWSAGGTIVVDTRADAFARLGAEGETDAFLVPPMIDQLIAARGPKSPKLDTTRLILAGGLLATPVIERAKRCLTPLIRNSYGVTEINNILLLLDLEEVAEPEDYQWMNLVPGSEIEIVDEDGAPCPDGEEGYLRYRLQANDAPGYWGDPEATAQIFRGEWFYPGDLACRRADGRIRVLGRAEDVFVFKGVKFAVAPFEARLRRYFEVDELCVFSGHDATGRERMIIAIERDEPLPPERLKPVSDRLAAYGRLVITFHKAFPRTGNGMFKIRRAALRREILAKLAAG